MSCGCHDIGCTEDHMSNVFLFTTHIYLPFVTLPGLPPTRRFFPRRAKLSQHRSSTPLSFFPGRNDGWKMTRRERKEVGGREGTDFFGQSRLPSDSEQGRGRKESTIDEDEDGIDRKPGWQGLTVGASFPILNLLFTYIAWRRERGNVSCHEQFSTNLGAGIPIFPSFCLLSRVFGASVEWLNLSPFYRIRRERKKESFRIRFMLCRCTVAPCRTDSHSPLSSNEQETQLCAAG